MVVLHKRADMSDADFRAYLRGIHGDLAKKLPGLRRYVQNYRAADENRAAPGWDAIVELYWDSREAMEAAWASPEGQRATADVAPFADLGRTSWAMVDEEAFEFPESPESH